MKTIKGPALFLAQFVGDEAPFNTLDSICKWAADLGYKGIQIPGWDKRLIDLDRAAESQSYCDELLGRVREHGLEITELSAHLQGQLVAVHPSYDRMFEAFAPDEFKGNYTERSEWAKKQVENTARASRNLGLNVMAGFSGALAWPYLYPWPQRPPGLIDMAFNELAERWKPILDSASELGVKICFELHPGEDLHDGKTFEMFMDKVNDHPAVGILYDPSHFLLQQLDYLSFIDIYHQYIGMFHVKDAEFNPTGKQGVYGAYQSWEQRAGRFRSPGDGQVDFISIFSKLSQYGFDGWAVIEWECCIKSPEQGAREGARFINDHIIEVTDKSFDDFAGGDTRDDDLKKILGI